jgi:CRISPR-associated protein Cst2
VINGIIRDDQPDYPGAEFHIGGKLVKDMSTDRAEKLKERGVTLDRDPRRLLAAIGERLFPAKGS